MIIQPMNADSSNEDEISEGVARAELTSIQVQQT